MLLNVDEIMLSSRNNLLPHKRCDIHMFPLFRMAVIQSLFSYVLLELHLFFSCLAESVHVADVYGLVKIRKDKRSPKKTNTIMSTSIAIALSALYTILIPLKNQKRPPTPLYLKKVIQNQPLPKARVHSIEQEFHPHHEVGWSMMNASCRAPETETIVDDEVTENHSARKG